MKGRTGDWQGRRGRKVEDGGIKKSGREFMEVTEESADCRWTVSPESSRSIMQR